MEAEVIDRTRAQQELAGLYVISRIFSAAGDFESKATQALEILAVLAAADWVTLRLPKKEEPGLHLVAASGPAVAEQEPVQVFTEAMTSNSKLEAVAVCEAYDFSGFHSMVDVGGGEGFLLATILKAYPALKGMLFDRPEVGARARKLLRAEGLGERCEVIDGDFFAGVPQGGEAYILKNILHDWDDERAEQILTHCREAIVPGGRVLVMETVILPGNEPSPGKLLDIQMLVGTPGGRERTEAEFRTLFTRAGLELTRSVPTKSPVNVLEGVPV